MEASEDPEAVERLGASRVATTASSPTRSPSRRLANETNISVSRDASRRCGKSWSTAVDVVLTGGDIVGVRVAGTATAVVGGVQGHQQAKAQTAANAQAADQANEAEMAAMQAQLNQLQAQQAAPAPAPAATSGGGDDLMAQLQDLAKMHESGVLDDAEFAAAKARLLTG